MSALRSDDLNYLIFRYLVEAGYPHSAFAFGNESNAKAFKGMPTDFGPGALLEVVQKGLQYKECEACDRQRLPFLPGRYSAGDILRASRLGKPLPLAPAATLDRLKLEGHTGLVFTVSWNPKHDLLASSSSDCTGRIWQVQTSSGPLTGQSVACELLQHATHESNGLRDIPSLTWSADGNELATASYDSIGRVWGRNGFLQQCMNGHTDPILKIQYSPDNRYLLTASVDKTAILWHAASNTIMHRVTSHSASVLDVTWLDDATFATCSKDGSVHVFRMHLDASAGAQGGNGAVPRSPKKGRPRDASSAELSDRGTDAAVPQCTVEWVRAFRGHTNDVNQVCSAHGGQMLASCSDDRSARLWRLDQEEAIHTFVDASVEPGNASSRVSHAAEVNVCCFQPTASSARPILQLATASLDSTVKIWNCDTGELLHTLAQHSQGVYTIAWSPDGTKLASGGMDKQLALCDTDSGDCVQLWSTSGDVFSAAWHKDGHRLAVALGDGTIDIFEL